MDGDAASCGARGRSVHCRGLHLRQNREKPSQPENAGTPSARDQSQAADSHAYERRHAGAIAKPALSRGQRRPGGRVLSMDATPSNARSVVTTRQVFAIAGPAMLANLTTPLIGIVSTTAIGRLGDATLPSAGALRPAVVRRLLR